MKLPDINHGIVMELNLGDITTIERIVKDTYSLDFIAAYKIGAEAVLGAGLKHTVEIIKNFTSLPLIYDHHKFGSDSPEISSGEMLNILKNSGIEGLIIIPFGGIETLKSAVKKCLELDITPIIGGDMDHGGYSQLDGGYIDNIAPQKMYIDGANSGATHFIIPCTRTDRMKIYCHRLESMVTNPVLFITGAGRRRSEELLNACQIVKDYRSFAIIGEEITGQDNYRRAAEEIWKSLPTKK